MSIGAVLGERPVATPTTPHSSDQQTVGQQVVDQRAAEHPTRALRHRYHDYTALPGRDLIGRAREELLDEAALVDDRQREAVYRRLSAWLDLDPEDARIVARAFDDATAALSPDLARHRLEVERDAMLHGFAFADFRRLADFIPWLSTDEGIAVIGAAMDLAPAA